MLTAKQIEAALHQIEHEYDGFGDSRDELLRHAHTALAAYERVAALRADLHTLVHELGCDNEATQLEAERILDLLDRALEGC